MYVYNKHDNLIKNLLLDRCPELDMNTTERIILDECRYDLSLYINYLLENNMVPDKMFMEYFCQFVLNYDIGLDHMVQPIISAEDEVKYDADCKKYAKILVDEWWNKFQVRTQVKLNRTEEEKKVMEMMGHVKPVFTEEELIDLRYYVAMILIKNGERVFIRMMVNNIIIGVLAMRVSKTKTTFTPQDKLQLTQVIGFEAKELTKKRGPLIYMFADKGYYQAKMRGWGNDNHGKVL